jgi:hypothetical protein
MLIPIIEHPFAKKPLKTLAKTKIKKGWRRSNSRLSNLRNKK